MKTRIVFVTILALAVAAVAQAQVTADQKAMSDRILKKIQTLDMYNQILPVLFTKDQLNAILPVIERHRADVRTQELDENKIMISWEKELDDAIEHTKKTGELPKPETLNMPSLYFKAFAMKRKAIVDDAVDKLKSVLKEKCNEGQLKAAENALDPRLYIADADPDKMTDDQKLDLWVRMVLLDTVSYDILVDLTKK